jgi:hypothetical protein
MPNITTLAVGGNDVVSVGRTTLQVFNQQYDLADAATAGVGSGDSFTALYLPEGTYFKLLGVKNITVLTGVTNYDVGDEDDADEFVDNAAVTAGVEYNLTADAEFVKDSHSDGEIVKGTDSEVRITCLGGAPLTGKIQLIGLISGAVNLPNAVPRVYPN